MKKTLSSALVYSLIAATVAACGGGGSDLNDSTGNGGTTTPPPGTGTGTGGGTTPTIGSGTTMTTISGSGLGTDVLRTVGTAYNLVAVNDVSGLTRKLTLTPKVSILLDPSQVVEEKVGPLTVVRIASGIVIRSSVATASVSDISPQSETRTAFGAVAGDSKQVLLSIVAATQPTVPGPQGWSCAANGGTLTEPYLGGPTSDYATTGTASFTLTSNAIAWKPNLTVHWTGQISKKLTQERTYALGIAQDAVEVADTTQVLTMGQRANGKASVSLSWKIRQFADDANSLRYGAITTFSCTQVSGPADVTPPGATDPKDPPVQPTDPTAPPLAPPVAPNPSKPATTSEPAVSTGSVMTLRGGVAGLTGFMGLVSTNRAVDANGSIVASNAFPSLLLTYRSMSGNSSQWADYYNNYGGDTFLNAGVEYYDSVLVGNSYTSNLGMQTFGGATPTLGVGAVKTGAYMQNQTSTTPVNSSFGIDGGPGLFYAIADLKAPARELMYQCGSPVVVGARMGIGSASRSLGAAQTLTGGGILTLAGTAGAEDLKSRLHVVFQPALKFPAISAGVTTTFDSSAVARSVESNYQYDGWDATALEKVGLMVVPGEEYLAADVHTRKISVLYKLATASGLLHGAAVLTCTR